MKNPAYKLITHYGSIGKAADAFGCSYESMRRWVRNGIPLEVCLDVEKASDKLVIAEEIVQFWRGAE